MFLEAYRMQWNMTNGQDTACEVIIYDRLSGAGTPVFTDLQPSEDAFRLFVRNNEEDKFKNPIRALQAQFQFESDEVTNLNSFITEEDNRWLVVATVGSITAFTGYLITEDMQEDFQDYEAGNTVTLHATDNLGLLKDEVLVNDAGTNPQGFFSIIQYIAMALERTGLSLPINVRHNLKFEHDNTKIWYQSGFLEAKTFEDRVNVSLDCYTVLEMIFGFDAYLTQSNGEWWIIAINELDYANTIVHRFEANGDFQETLPAAPVPEKAFGYNEIMQFSEMAAYNVITAPVKDVEIEFPFEYPKEIINNIDFERGTFSAPASGVGFSSYIPEGFTIKSGTENFPVTPVAPVYIKKFYDADDYEIERYMAFPYTVGTGSGVESNRVPVEQFDKFFFGIDFKFGNNVSGGLYHLQVQIMLYGYDGSKWVFGNTVIGNAYKWGVYVEGSSAGDWYLRDGFNLDATDETQYRTIAAEIGPAPVSGELVVRFGGQGPSTEIRFANLRFNYIPYINGSYQKYNSQSSKISQDLDTKRVLHETVSISNAPKPLFKGALFVHNGTRYVLAPRMFDGLQHATVPPDDGSRQYFRTHQAYVVWQHYFRPYRIFDFQAQDLNGVPDLTYRYTITDPSEHSDNALFMLLHFEIDFSLGTIKGVLAEIQRDGVERDYASPLVFRYLTDRS